VLQFCVQSILEGGVYVLALFGFYGFVRPHSKGWVTRRIRGWGDCLSKQTKWVKGVIWLVILSLFLGLFTMSRIASWQQLTDNPIRKEAEILANAIEADVGRGIEPSNIFQRYQHQIETVVPRLLGSGDTPEITALSKGYERSEISHSAFTNLASLVRMAGRSIR
jgi:hypothetical protein